MHSKRKFIPKRNSNNNGEDDEIKNIIKEINSSYRHTLFFDTRAPNKIKTIFRRNNFSTIDIKSNTKRTLKREDSLTFQLKNKISKESLIMELREELKYHYKFSLIYKKLLSKIIYLKDAVKLNKEQLEANTNSLKEAFKDRFEIIDNYEKAIKLLNLEKKELVTSNKDILKIRQNANKILLVKYKDIQEKNNVQRKELDELDKKITFLENKKTTINEELQNQLINEQKKYEKYLKLYKILKNKYEYFLEEYNSYMKSGDEITKVEVKLFDDTNARNSIIEEDLEVKLNEKLIKKDNLVDKINQLKIKIKYLEEKQKEEKEREEKNNRRCKVMRLYNSKMKFTTTLKKSASSKSYKTIFS